MEMKLLSALIISSVLMISMFAVVDASAEDRIEIDLELLDLEPLDEGHYEGWIIVDGSPVSTGKFNVDAMGDITDIDGMMMDMPFMVKDIDPDMISNFVVSIEPEGDTDTVPGTIKPLAGDYDKMTGKANLTPNIGVDLSGISGSYILATPSNNVESMDFDLTVDLSGLPMLDSGHYEGWLIVDGSPVSTGKFNVDAMGDIVDLGGMMMTMPFLVENIDIDMVEKFVLSIEPEGDTDMVPSSIKPISGNFNMDMMKGDLMVDLGVDLSEIGGQYILATPSNNDDYYLDLEFENLMSLSSGHYEGWLIVDGSPVSTGKFNVDAMGDIVDLDGMMMTMPFLVMDIDPMDVSMFVLSIEEEGDTDSIPGSVKPLAGAYESSMMNGMISHNIGVDLSSAMGEYILATPSDGGMTNELSGIWYLNRSTGTPVAGLDLPDLSGTDWVYEGWIVIDGVPVTSGTFDSPEGVDDFDDYSNSTMYPPFPGEDFLLNAPTGVTFPTDLSGQTAVISIEPRMDNDPMPFQFKPLVGMIPDMAMDHLEYQMMNKVDSLPTGSFELSSAPTDELSGIWFLDRSSGTPVAGLDLPDLSGTDWVYEGWVVIGGIPVTTGTFDTPAGFDDFDDYSASDAYPPFPGEDLLMDAPSGVTFPTDLSGQIVVISIEPKMDNDPAPFFLKPLMGTVPSDAMDHLEYDLMDNMASFPMGEFSLERREAPPTNELSGIWYLELVEGSPVAGLDLPDLTGTDWIYEGWVVIDGVAVTSGRFDSPDGFDNFDEYSASDAYPPFPGEDFLMGAPTGVTFPTDLSGQMAVISIEPRMDDDPAPFQFKPLVGMIPTDAADHMVYDMDDMSSSLPSGMVTITVSESSSDDTSSSAGFVIGIVGVVILIVIVGVIVLVISTRKQEEEPKQEEMETQEEDQTE